MKEITYFYLDGCPFCRRADNMIGELIRENPEYGEIRLIKIEEREQKDLAGSFDYYYVPALYLGTPETEPRKKLHEGVPTAQKLKKAFDEALAAR